MIGSWRLLPLSRTFSRSQPLSHWRIKNLEGLCHQKWKKGSSLNFPVKITERPLAVGFSTHFFKPCTIVKVWRIGLMAVLLTL